VVLRDRINNLSVKLYDYQVDAIERLWQSIASGKKRVILALATGAGKSIIARAIVELAQQKNTQCLYTAHRDILRSQMQNTLRGLDNVVVDTLQSHRNRQYDDIKIIIVDECHFGNRTVMQESVMQKYPNAIIVGLSATPINADGTRLEGWDEVIDVLQLVDLIERKRASPVRVLSPKSIDRSNFKVRAGEYVEKDVEQEVLKSAIVTDVVGKWETHARGLRTIFYCLNIKHSELITERLVARGYRASMYHSKMKDRREVFERFRNGELQVLVSIETLTTGVDLPDIYCLVLATPIRSTIKAVQIYGRGTRIDPQNTDKECLVLDMANVIDDTVHPMDLLNFNLVPDQKGKKHFCGGTWKVYKKDVIIEHIVGVAVQRVTTTYRCDNCGELKSAEDEKAITVSFCENCNKEIEAGTASTYLVEKENKILVMSKCPHCEHDKIVREIEAIDVGLVERGKQKSTIESWDDMYAELRQARGRDGKKYHHYWAKRVIDEVQSRGITLQHFKQKVEEHKRKKWVLGGILNSI